MLKPSRPVSAVPSRKGFVLGGFAIVTDSCLNCINLGMNLLQFQYEPRAVSTLLRVLPKMQQSKKRNTPEYPPVTRTLGPVLGSQQPSCPWVPCVPPGLWAPQGAQNNLWGTLWPMQGLWVHGDLLAHTTNGWF